MFGTALAFQQWRGGVILNMNLNSFKDIFNLNNKQNNLSKYFSNKGS
jgi:hypothetical protein